MNITLRRFPYNYLPYEERLLLREAQTIGGIVKADDLKVQLSVVGADVELVLSRLHRLTYFSHFSIGHGPVIPTQQFLLETTANGSGNGARQSTRYSTHGLHEYKGKFHPQIARYLMAHSGLTTQSLVLDPFAGSGTVLVEAVHYGCNAVGIEANPLAALVANSKLKLLTSSDRELKQFEKVVEGSVAKLGTRKSVKGLAKELELEAATLDYLQSWFPSPVLLLLLEFRASCREGLGLEWARVSDSLVSSIAREVSHQDPADLRIRRRKKPLDDAPVAGLLGSVLKTVMTRTVAARNLFGDSPTYATELAGDSRNLRSVLASVDRTSVDAIITSPPYATALPYIDTSRLSLVLLGLCTASDLRRLERTQIGNREITPSERKQGEEAMESKLQSLPREVHLFIKRLLRKLKGSDAGFRRLNMPVLLLQYFSDMQAVLKQTHAVLSQTGSSHWLVGPNRTQIGGNWLDIDTPRWIATIAEDVGFSSKVEELDAYQRFSLHQRNAIRQEFLISMRPV